MIYLLPNFLQIIFTEAHYEKMEGKFCVDTFDSFSNLTAAKTACSEEFFCKGVNDQNCDGSEFTLCLVGYDYSDASGLHSCAIYDKKGMIYSFL